MLILLKFQNCTLGEAWAPLMSDCRWAVLLFTAAECGSAIGNEGRHLSLHSKQFLTAQVHTWTNIKIVTIITCDRQKCKLEEQIQKE